MTKPLSLPLALLPLIFLLVLLAVNVTLFGDSAIEGANQLALICGVLNLTASEQYLTIRLAGRMYAGMYQREGLTNRNLSRTLKDSGTVTSVLVPWNTCGAYHAAALGVATLSYLPFCFFNLISPIMTIIHMRFNIAIDEQSLTATTPPL